MSIIEINSVPTGYRTQADDIDTLTDLMVFKLLRQKTPAQRLEMASAHNRGFRALFLAGLRRQYSKLSAVAVAKAMLKDSYPAGFRPQGSEMTWIQDSIELALQLHATFAALSIPYYVTGGLAAITYGEYRTTQDVDVVLDIAREDITRLVTPLEGDGFYIPGIEDVQTGRMNTLSITHTETIARADLMITSYDAFAQAKFEHRQLVDIPGRGSLFFISAEDLVLNKLRWRQRSQSEKQWRDILGVLKTQQNSLEIHYMRSWAESLFLLPDLEQALQAAGINQN